MNKLAAAKPCAGCGHTEFTRDFLATAGDILCLLCGMVQIENPIVSEVQFGESSSGAATVQGSMVGADQARVYNMRNSLESREQTLMNARQKIKLLAAAMRIPEYIHESAHGWFKLALVQNFVQGRRSQNVIAACLYVACRHEKTPHLLIDFSSRLQISVYSLGATYLKLVRALQIQRLPLADPSLFIQHFAERLDFKEHTAKVCRDATKIAQRMSSDWIYEGRRPAGIAGACLLLAARMNNFRRSHGEIVAVARVGEETLQKRLNEFKKTSSALLSVLDFRESTATNDSQPPSFHKNRAIENKIEKLLKQRSHTLKKYKELAKRRELFSHLHLDDEPHSAMELKTGADIPDKSVKHGISSEVQEAAALKVSSQQPANESTESAVQHAPNEQFSGQALSPAPASQPMTGQYFVGQDLIAGEITEPESQPVHDKHPNVGVKEAVSGLLEEAQQHILPQNSLSELCSDSQKVSADTDTRMITNPPANNLIVPGSIDELKSSTNSTATHKPGNGAGASDPEDQVNALFVPHSDDDEDPYGYNTLPSNSDEADKNYDEHHRKIIGLRQRNLRSSAILALENAPAPVVTNAASKKTGRLGSITGSRAVRGRSKPSSNETAPEDKSSKKSKQDAELKKLKEKQKAEEQEARNDELLKAVLQGGDIKEDDLEIALDRILQGQSKTLDTSLYRTPAQIQNESDLLKRIELDRPRNLVKHNPTTSQILARVRDDETINSDDEDEEVMNVKLSEDEKHQKERIWIALNHDFLIAQEKKRLKIEADELTGNTSGQPRKRRKIKEADALLDDAAVANAIHQIGEGGRMISPAENAKQMLQKKSFSRKINYSSIGDLFNE